MDAGAIQMGSHSRAPAAEGTTIGSVRGALQHGPARRAMPLALQGQYRVAFDHAPEAILLATLEGVVSEANESWGRLLGVAASDLRGCRLSDFAATDEAVRSLESLRAVVQQARTSNVTFRQADGTLLLTDLAVAAVDVDGHPMLLVTGHDVTRQRRLEDVIQRAQRMEAIGQLTGGIAHDFNNLLAAILANAHFLLQALPEGDARRVDAEEINAAAERAAALTRQLLTFSRKYVLEPKCINLNATILGVEKMLRRLICEDIELTTVLQSELQCVHADQGQLEQVIVNLVVNARDAMPRGGRLAIETANVEFLEPHAHGEVAIPAGRYVMLAVSDTGVGMNEETKQRLFEPFFTTKEVGRGTGLGLSTCYGIVKQSAGFIWVYSEVDHGTEFRIYLPASDEPIESPRALPASQSQNGSETVLLIEDDERVRCSVSRILRSRGYHVLATRNGAEAEVVAAAHMRPIDVVISDVVMPGMSGPEVVARLRERSAIGKALFMSGHAEHSALANGLQTSELQFIQKPFAPESLARKLREVLDR